MVAAQGADTAVVFVMAVGEIDAGAPSDLSGHVTHSGQGSGGNADDGRKVKIIFHHSVQNAECIQSLPAAALQNEGTLCNRIFCLAGRQFVKLIINFHNIAELL